MKTGKIISVPVTDPKAGMQVVKINSSITTISEVVSDCYAIVDNDRGIWNIRNIKTLAVEHNGFRDITQFPLAPSQWQQAIDKGLVDSGREVYFEEVNKDMWSKHKGDAEIVAKIVTTGSGELLDIPSLEKKAIRIPGAKISEQTREEFAIKWAEAMKNAEFQPLIAEPAQKLYSEEYIKEKIHLALIDLMWFNKGENGRNIVNEWWNNNK